MRTYIFFLLFIFISSVSSAQTSYFEREQYDVSVTSGGWSYGVAAVDFNNDGYADLFVTNNDDDNGNQNFLYINNGDRTFSLNTNSVLYEDMDDSYGCSAADYDNDGDIDLFVANYDQNNALYENLGDGTFNKIAEGNIVTDGGRSVSGSWADYDNDGFLDLYVVNRNEKNFFYKNNGNGTFTRIYSGNFLSGYANSGACSWVDINLDGYQDLMVNNIDAPDKIFMNNGDGSFDENVIDFFVADTTLSTGATWIDYDNDGDFDAYIPTGVLGMSYDLFIENNGDNTFTSANNDLTQDMSWISSGNHGDFNKDGYQDIFVSYYDGDNRLYINQSGTGFAQVSESSITEPSGYNKGVAVADFDNDGALDLYVARNNYHSGNSALYWGIDNQANWIAVKCEGVESNRSAVGALVRVKANINNVDIWQLQYINTQAGGGYTGQNDFKLFFGLGDTQKIDSLVVDWPSGNQCVYKDLTANQSYNISENCITHNSTLTENPDIECFPNPSRGAFSLINAKGSQIRVFNINGELIMNLKVNSNRYPFTLQNKQSNQFIMKIIFDDKIITKKLILIR